jgi:hypothetical protein
MENYSINIWESETKSPVYDRPTFTIHNIHAVNAEMALQQVMRANNMHVIFLAEVSWNDGRDRRQFKNYSLE